MEITMNRLILIGNGFDLAHGIKTSFKDFLSDYFLNVINQIISDRVYLDQLLIIKNIDYDYYEFLDYIERLREKEDPIVIIGILFNSPNFDFQFLSPLLESLFHKCATLFWVDIEMEYFNLLLESRQKEKEEDLLDLVKELNSQLDYLRGRLIDYLTRQQQEYGGAKDRTALIGCFLSEIKAHEIVTEKLDKNIKPENLYFLNFNYTNTIEHYVDFCNDIINSQKNFIHGDLRMPNGRPIFGFGDELDKRYLEFEDEQNNELFKHIKSFEYLQTKNFYLLTRFIESGDFQVHIYGHSCGLSDRTLLNQIFEHENCKSIKIFYFKENESFNDFTDKTYEISRHFRDKTLLRKKLVPFDLSEPMPQPGNLND